MHGQQNIKNTQHTVESRWGCANTKRFSLKVVYTTHRNM